MAAERLQKVLAAAGIASRRKAEEFITSGRVTINGEVVTALGTKADPRTDEIRIDGAVIGRPERHVYYMMYKPKGVVTTLSDPENRPTVAHMLQEKGVKERVFPVGRLDYMSEGLLLFTNDGDLMEKLTHAGSHVPKTYQVKVSGQPTEEDIDKLRAGIWLPPEPSLTGGRGPKKPGVERRSYRVKTLPAKIELVRQQDNPWYEVTLTEGRNRQIRRMFEEINVHVEKIKRVRYGSLSLNVDPGEIRQLSFGEIKELRESLDKPLIIKPPRARREDGEGRPARGARFERGERPSRGFDRERPSRGRTDRERSDSDRPRRKSEGREFERGGERKRGFGDRTMGGRTMGDRPMGERRGREERGERPERGAARPYRERPERGRSEGTGFERNSEGRQGRSRSFEDRRENRGFGRSTGDRPFRQDRREQGEGFGGGERREGRPGFDRGARGEGRPTSDRFPRRERSESGDRPQRRERPAFGDRPARGERSSFGDRPQRRERPAFSDRPQRRDRSESSERPRRERSEFGERPQRGERPAFGDRPQRRERPASGDRPTGDRPQRRSGFGAQGRPSGDRANKRPFSGRPTRERRPGRERE